MKRYYQIYLSPLDLLRQGAVGALKTNLLDIPAVEQVDVAARLVEGLVAVRLVEGLVADRLDVGLVAVAEEVRLVGTIVDHV